MDSQWLKDDLALAIEAAREAGKGLLRHFGSSLEVSYKSPDQPVTTADLEADAFLRDSLLGLRPDYGWISEEMAVGEERRGTREWVVDPLDGTGNFIAGRGDFAICIGLLEEGRPVLGVIHHPVEDATYSACAGGGAFLNSQRIEAAPVPSQDPVLVASYGEAGRGRILTVPHGELLLVGSTALKMVRVAEGRAHIYVSTTPKGSWDVCAGEIIVAEAGGSTADLAGRPLFSADAGSDRIRGLIVTGREGGQALQEASALFEGWVSD